MTALVYYFHTFFHLQMVHFSIIYELQKEFKTHHATPRDLKHTLATY